ncbi:MAG: hypothetical protein V7606_3796, partial [Burkholderiales bacterium]
HGLNSLQTSIGQRMTSAMTAAVTRPRQAGSGWSAVVVIEDADWCLITYRHLQGEMEFGMRIQAFALCTSDGF